MPAKQTIIYTPRMSAKTISKVRASSIKKEVSFVTMCRLLIVSLLEEFGIESPASASTPIAGEHTDDISIQVMP